MTVEKEFFGSVMLGLSAEQPAYLRDTEAGYVIRSAPPGGNGRCLRDLGARFATVVAWLVVVGLWLMPMARGDAGMILAKVLTTAVILGLTYLGVALLRRARGHEVQIDTRRRNFRLAVLNARGESRIKSTVAFDDVADLVLQTVGEASVGCCLCLRLTDGTLVPICAGGRATLLAFHDRLARDLRPAEEITALHKLRGTLTPRQRMRAAFPLLAPEEIRA